MHSAAILAATLALLSSSASAVEYLDGIYGWVRLLRRRMGYLTPVYGSPFVGKKQYVPSPQYAVNSPDTALLQMCLLRLEDQ